MMLKGEHGATTKKGKCGVVVWRQKPREGILFYAEEEKEEMRRGKAASKK
jgi:hypothetical protein